MKKRNDGFTLVELLISLTILAIIGIAIASFLYTGTRQYSAASTETTLQTEAQTVQNQLQNRILEVSEGVYTTVSGGFYQDGSQIELYGKQGTTGEKIQIAFDSSKGELLYTRYELKESLDAGGRKVYEWQSDAEATGELFASYVTGFSVDLCDGEGNPISESDKGNRVEQVKISISYELNQRKQESYFVVTPRNRVMVSDEVEMLYGD